MLQFITHRNERYDEISGTRAVLEGGCRWVQLRMKDAPDAEFLRVGREVGRLCQEYGATFLLDDRVHLVAELGADGVHLGKHDMPVAEARRLLPDAETHALKSAGHFLMETHSRAIRDYLRGWIRYNE